MRILRKHLKLLAALCFCLFMTATALPAASSVAVGAAVPTTSHTGQEGAASVAASVTGYAKVIGAVLGTVYISYEAGRMVGRMVRAAIGPLPEEQTRVVAFVQDADYDPLDFSAFDG